MAFYSDSPLDMFDCAEVLRDVQRYNCSIMASSLYSEVELLINKLYQTANHITRGYSFSDEELSELADWYDDIVSRLTEIDIAV